MKLGSLRPPARSSPRRAETSGRAQSYLTGLASAWLLRVIGPAAGFLLTPYILAKLGREAFGAYTLALAVVGWLAVVDLGLASSLRVALARRLETGSRESLQTLFSSVNAAQAFFRSALSPLFPSSLHCATKIQHCDV